MRLIDKEVSLKPNWTLVLETDNNISVYDENNNLLYWPLQGRQTSLPFIQNEFDFTIYVQSIANLHSWDFEKNTNFPQPAFTFTEK